MLESRFPADQDNPFSAERNPAPAPRNRDTYGLPMFLAAWIGANAQWAGLQWPDFGFIAFLGAVTLILLLASTFNRR